MKTRFCLQHSPQREISSNLLSRAVVTYISVRPSSAIKRVFYVCRVSWIPNKAIGTSLRGHSPPVQTQRKSMPHTSTRGTRRTAAHMSSLLGPDTRSPTEMLTACPAHSSINSRPGRYQCISKTFTGIHLPRGQCNNLVYEKRTTSQVSSLRPGSRCIVLSLTHLNLVPTIRLPITSILARSRSSGPTFSSNSSSSSSSMVLHTDRARARLWRNHQWESAATTSTTCRPISSSPQSDSFIPLGIPSRSRDAVAKTSGTCPTGEVVGMATASIFARENAGTAVGASTATSYPISWAAATVFVAPA